MLDDCGREIPLSELEQLTQDQHSASSQPPRERTYDVDKLYAEYEDELSKAHRRAIGPRPTECWRRTLIYASTASLAVSTALTFSKLRSRISS